MATVAAAQQDHMKPRKKVRLIAKIRGFNPKEHNSEPWIRVREDESSNRVVLSFGDQSDRDLYEVDSCYEQGHDNLSIYSREVKPLLPSVYDGQNLTIIGFGARGSGKTYTIQGNEEEQGLAALATAEILSGNNENGMSISFSLFEVFHEHVYDLLDPKRPEVQVLEDAQGNIKLKGLSEGILKSVSEVQKLYSLGYSTNRRSHKGLIVKVSSKSGTSSSKIVGKLTIVDLAGFVDARRKSCDGVDLIENSRINKSLYALLNVVHAANAQEPRVPFRESKLTRMLQDSFGEKNPVLLFACLNPFLCHDTVFTLSLASRSCQGVNRMSAHSMQKSKYLIKPIVSSAIKGKLNVGSSAKKQASSTPYISMRNKSLIAKERKIDHKGKEASGLKQSKVPSASEMQSRFLSEINSEIASSLQEEEELMPEVLDVEATKDEGTSILHALEDTELKEETEQPRVENHNSEVTPSVDGNAKTLTLFEGDNKEKENDGFYVKGDGSPPLSSRLQELSNNLRNLYNSTPIQIKLPPEADSSCGEKISCTKVLEPNTPVQDKLDVARFNSPREKFNARSSGLKHSLADEYLKFINSASKEELKGLPGIGERRATYILELREESPEPFKNLEDLKDIGLSAKQINGMMKKVAGDLFNK